MTQVTMAVYKLSAVPGDLGSDAWRLVTGATPTILDSAGDFDQGAAITVEFQVKTDAVVDGNLLVTGTVTADAIAANSITASKIVAADAKFDTLIADVASFGSIDTDTLNATAVIARTVQVGEAGNLPAVSGATPSGRGALLKSDGDFFVGNASTSKYMFWDQTTNILTVKGNLTATSGTIGGFTLGSDVLYAGAGRY